MHMKTWCMCPSERCGGERKKKKKRLIIPLSSLQPLAHVNLVSASSLRPFEEDTRGKRSPKTELLRLGGSLRRGDHSGRWDLCWDPDSSLATGVIVVVEDTHALEPAM